MSTLSHVVGPRHLFTKPSTETELLHTVTQFAETAMMELSKRGIKPCDVSQLQHPTVGVIYRDMKPVGMFACHFGNRVPNGRNKLVTVLFDHHQPYNTAPGEMLIRSDVTFPWDDAWMSISGYYPSGVLHERGYVYSTYAGEYLNVDGEYWEHECQA